MFTIWFSSDDVGQRWSVDVQGLQEAQEVWDRLCSCFFMISTRP